MPYKNLSVESATAVSLCHLAVERRSNINEQIGLDSQKKARCTKDVQRQVLAYVQRERLLPAGRRVVIGVSGGPDSLCLLHLLWTLRHELGIQVHAAHLNHLIRGSEADTDAQFVADLTASWHIPSTIASRDVPALAREQKLAIEEAARRARYVFLAQVAHQTCATHIAVGHNADDQSETVLMHWLRGAGLAGLRGMLPATRLTDLRLLQAQQDRDADQADLWLVRPLLDTERSDIERYCRAHNLVPRFDRSNLDTTYYRNKLRHELLPLLEHEYKPRFGKILRRSARVIRDDYDLLCTVRDRTWKEIVRRESDEAIVLDREAWTALHPSLQRAILRQAVYRLRRSLRDVNFVHIEAAMEVAHQGIVGCQATLPSDVMLTVGYAVLTVADIEYAPSPDFPALSTELTGRTPLTVPGTTLLPGRLAVEIDIRSRSALPLDWQNNVDPWCAYLDVHALGLEAFDVQPAGPKDIPFADGAPALFLRRRKDGDRFCPLGMGGHHKRVSDLLVNAKVPSQWRDQIPLLVRKDDTILWVCGWRMDERARVHNQTSRIVVVRLRPADEAPRVVNDPRNE
jgi:tRNA(Ile)-lysidine synthase